MLSKLSLIVALLVTGCSTAPALPTVQQSSTGTGNTNITGNNNTVPTKSDGEHVWKVKHDSPYDGPGSLHKLWVCTVNGRTDDIEILRYDGGPYSVFVRGSGYGDYETLETAEKVGMRMYQLRGLKCPEGLGEDGR